MVGLLLLDWSFTYCVGKIEWSMEEVMVELLLRSEEVEVETKQREVLGFAERDMFVVVP